MPTTFRSAMSRGESSPAFVQPPANARFSEGDVVMTVRATYGWGAVREGEKGVVRGYIRRGSTHVVIVKFKNYDSWQAIENDLQLVSKNNKLDEMKKNRIIVELLRNKDLVRLYIKVPEQIEKFFQDLTAGVLETSSAWKASDKDSIVKEGAQFYSIKGNAKWATIEEQLNRSLGRYESTRVFNNYGDTLIKDGYINLAPLRTVGAKDGVYICASKFTDIAMIDFESYVKMLGTATKALWLNHIGETSIKAQIAF